MAEKADAVHAWMPIYWGDYLRDTAHLSAAEHGAYLLMIGHYWTTGCPLPDDDDKIRRIARMERAEWRRSKGTLAAFFEIRDGRWRHGRIDAELDLWRARKERNRNRASNAASKRWASSEQSNKDAPSTGGGGEGGQGNGGFCDANSHGNNGSGGSRALGANSLKNMGRTDACSMPEASRKQCSGDALHHSPSSSIRSTTAISSETSRAGLPSQTANPGDATKAAAMAVARRFIEQREKHWPDTSRLPAPMTTIVTQAQQRIAAGGTVELLIEVIDRGFETWRKPTPPQSLDAFCDSLSDRVAEFVRAGQAPEPRQSGQQHRQQAPQPEHIVPDRNSQHRMRLRTFRDKGEWLWPGEPRPDSPRCTIDRVLLREEMGDEFMARFHPTAALPAPTHEAHHA